MTNITKGTVIIDSQETLRQAGIEPEAFNYLMKKLKLKVEYVETPDCPRDVDDILKSYSGTRNMPGITSIINGTESITDTEPNRKMK